MQVGASYLIELPVCLVSVLSKLGTGLQVVYLYFYSKTCLINPQVSNKSLAPTGMITGINNNDMNILM